MDEMHVGSSAPATGGGVLAATVGDLAICT